PFIYNRLYLYFTCCDFVAYSRLFRSVKGRGERDDKRGRKGAGHRSRGSGTGHESEAKKLARRSALPCGGPRDGRIPSARIPSARSEEHTSELQSRENLVCRLLLEKIT